MPPTMRTCMSLSQSVHGRRWGSQMKTTTKTHLDAAAALTRACARQPPPLQLFAASGPAHAQRCAVLPRAWLWPAGIRLQTSTPSLMGPPGPTPNAPPHGLTT